MPSQIAILIAVVAVMFSVIGGLSLLAHYYTIGGIHCLMIGAAGVGKTADFLFPNIEYACASGMSWLCPDTKGDLFRNYAGIENESHG